MEIPFKYIVLSIIKILYDRKMELSINKKILTDFLKEIIKKSFFTIEEKREMINNFDFDYELNNLLDEYYRYFEIEQENIVFEIDYASELDKLIKEEIEKNDITIIDEIEYIIENDTTFFEMLGVNIKKELYKILIDLEKEIEENYNELSDLDNYVGLSELNTKNLVNNIKKLLFKRMLLIMDVQNLLTNKEYEDLVRYSTNIAEENNDYEDLMFLIEDASVDETTIMNDVFLKSIFTCDELYYSTIKSRLNYQLTREDNNIKYNKLKFYLTYLELLEEEIKKDNELCSELVVVKYRLMQTIDTMYDTFTFINKNILSGIDFVEDYSFIEYEIYYFIEELLMYDDEKYKNQEFNTKKITVYIENTIKKILIATYYKLTKDKQIINAITNNKLYGINKISSSFFSDMVKRNNKKIKDI